MERTGKITFKGNPMTLIGPELKVGDKAPDFTVVDTTLQPVKLSDFHGQVVILSAVPSLDTPVCELQTKRFNEEASKSNAKVLTISLDLPFAQKRFCSSFQIENVMTLSDYKDRSFAHAFGLLIKELGLITRAVFVVNQEGKIVYQEIVNEVTEQPDYEKALAAAKNA
ncbi:MAG: thiol peroxidase [Candidatus Omnitrophota bacterium]|jgi:thiol peroxidase|nr:MAG: thiol peroxidase [Candidatus Omnitrophota bacterium]